MNVVNHLNDNFTSSSEEPSSSETSSIPSSDESSTTSIDVYINEKAIISHLLTITQEYDDKVNNIINVNYDISSLYIVSLTSDNKLSIYSGDLTNDIDLTLEGLITSLDGFSVTSKEASYSLTTLPSEDITTLEVFKSDSRYTGYSYMKKNNYYIDNELEDIALNAIGYKDNSYISITSLSYNVISHSIDDSDAYISSTSDPCSEYYHLLDYLYNS